MPNDLPDAPWAGGGGNLPDAPWAKPDALTAAGAREVPGQLARGWLGAGEQVAGDIYDVVTGKPLVDAARRIKGLVAGKPTPDFPVHSGEQLQEATPFVRDQPQTPLGEGARTLGGFLFPSPGGKGTAAAKFGSAVGSTIGYEAAKKATEGTRFEGPAELGGSIIGGHVPRAGKRFVNPNRSTAAHAADVEQLRRAGVEPTAGDVMDSTAMRNTESTVANAPGSGGAGSREHLRVGHEFTDAVLREMGSNANSATEEMPVILNDTKDRLQQSFDRVSTQLPILADRPMEAHYNAIINDLDAEGLPDASVNRIHQQLRNVNKAFSYQTSGRPVITGDSYQALTRKNSPLDRAMNDADPNIAHYATRIREMVDDAMERTASSPNATQAQRDALAELKQTRRQWYTMLVVSRIAAGAGEDAASGIISPQRLRAQLTRTDKDKINYAFQGGNLDRLSRAGNSVLASQRNSMTAERSLLLNLPRRVAEAAVGSTAGGVAGSHFGPIGGVLGAIGGAVAPGVTGRALMTKPAQKFLKRRGGPYSVPVGEGTATSAIGSQLQYPQSPEEVLDNPSGIPVQ